METLTYKIKRVLSEKEINHLKETAEKMKNSVGLRTLNWSSDIPSVDLIAEIEYSGSCINAPKKTFTFGKNYENSKFKIHGTDKYYTYDQKAIEAYIKNQQ